jgi:hypothetical protein
MNRPRTGVFLLLETGNYVKTRKIIYAHMQAVDSNPNST